MTTIRVCCLRLFVTASLLGFVPHQASAFLATANIRHQQQRTRRGSSSSSSGLYESCNSDHEQELGATAIATFSDKSSSSSSSSWWTQAQLEDYASNQGVVLSLTTLGPGYRAVARSKHNKTQILGYIEGFVRPTGRLLHVDKMEVFRAMVKRARQENPDEFRGGGTVLGVGLLIGYLCMLHGDAQGCRTAEFLAIDDEDFQHKRLVRYYKQAGFDFVKYVGDDFAGIPDRLVWGGCGTLLRKDIPFLLESWTRLMQKSLEDKG